MNLHITKKNSKSTSTAFTGVFRTWIFMKRYSAIPKGSYGLSRCSHHGCALLYLFPDLNSSSNKKIKKFLVPVTHAFCLLPSKTTCAIPLCIPIETLHSSVIFTWPGTSSQTQKVEEEYWSLVIWVHMNFWVTGETQQALIWQPQKRDNLKLAFFHEQGCMWPAHVTNLVVACWNGWPMALWLKSKSKTILPKFEYEKTTMKPLSLLFYEWKNSSSIT